MTTTLKLVQVAASGAVFAAAFVLPAAAAEGVHRHRAHHIHYAHAAVDRPLTVRSRYREPIYAAPDPFHGPAAIITAPVAVAGTIVGLPFQAVGAVFPAQGDPAVNPLVLIGAPVHVAGQFLQFPFYAVDSAFGAAPHYY